MWSWGQCSIWIPLPVARLRSSHINNERLPNLHNISCVILSEKYFLFSVYLELDIAELIRSNGSFLFLSKNDDIYFCITIYTHTLPVWTIITLLLLSLCCPTNAGGNCLITKKQNLLDQTIFIKSFRNSNNCNINIFI